MLIDFSDPTSIASWIALAPERHTLQVIALGELEHFAAFRWSIFRALRSQVPGCRWPWPGQPRRSGRRTE